MAKRGVECMVPTEHVNSVSDTMYFSSGHTSLCHIVTGNGTCRVGVTFQHCSCREICVIPDHRKSKAFFFICSGPVCVFAPPSGCVCFDVDAPIDQKERVKNSQSVFLFCKNRLFGFHLKRKKTHLWSFGIGWMNNHVSET